jgi:penicillin-binding protein 1A
MEVGPEAVVEAAHRMGIESDLQANTSIALGTSEVTPLELTAAYVPFANGGYRPDVHFVQRITTTDGDVLYEFTGGGNPRVVRADVVGMMNSMMTGTVEEGTARKAAFAWPAAGKTGTSQKSRDAWFIGYTANLTTGVWFGNDDGSPMKKVTGGALPALAWHEFMVAAHEGVPVAQLPGMWHGGAGSDTVARPDVPLAEAPRPQQPLSQRVESAGYETPQPQPEEPTSSIRRIVPPGDVGAPAPRRSTSILDILTGG